MYGDDEDRSKSQIQQLVKIFKNEHKTEEEILKSMEETLNKEEIQDMLNNQFIKNPDPLIDSLIHK
jgi:hypothetical protein